MPGYGVDIFVPSFHGPTTAIDCCRGSVQGMRKNVSLSALEDVRRYGKSYFPDRRSGGQRHRCGVGRPPKPGFFVEADVTLFYNEFLVAGGNHFAFLGFLTRRRSWRELTIVW